MGTKENLEINQMSSIDLAADLAGRLIEREARGAGDTDLAMRRIEAKFGVGYWTLWSLRYKRPKTIRADVFHQLRQAYYASCERQLAAISHDLALERARCGTDDTDADLAAEVDRLVAKVKAKRAVK